MTLPYWDWSVDNTPDAYLWSDDFLGGNGDPRADYAVTTGPFRKGEFIAEYWGRKLTEAQADPLETKYLFELNSKWTIDGSTRRNTARYINHSCRPNGKIDIRDGKIIIRAKRPIKEGEEITYHYGRNYFNAFIKPYGCRCAHCKKVKAKAWAAAKKVWHAPSTGKRKRKKKR